MVKKQALHTCLCTCAGICRHSKSFWFWAEWWGPGYIPSPCLSYLSPFPPPSPHSTLPAKSLLTQLHRAFSLSLLSQCLPNFVNVKVWLILCLPLPWIPVFFMAVLSFSLIPSDSPHQPAPPPLHGLVSSTSPPHIAFCSLFSCPAWVIRDIRDIRDIRWRGEVSLQAVLQPQLQPQQTHSFCPLCLP